MRIGTSILVMAVGAIMAFAVEVDRAEGFNINTAGIILMIIGALGFSSATICAPSGITSDGFCVKRPTSCLRSGRSARARGSAAR